MKKLILLLCLPLLVQVASADEIEYSFSGTQTGDTTFPTGPFTFTLTSTSLITSDLDNVVPGATLTCNACTSISMLPLGLDGGGLPHDEVLYQFPATMTGTTTFFFYFAPGSFEAPGVHKTDLLAGLNDATLTVTQSAVPEPSSAALLELGILGIGGMFLLRSARHTENGWLHRSF